MEKQIFDFFVALIEKIAGISYSPKKEYLIESRLNELALSLGYKDVKDIYQALKEKKFDLKLIDQIIEALVTNETYFFRDFHVFEAFKDYILPELFKKKIEERKINIWSAACSTGQEPYSISMILLEHFSHYLQTFKVYILASDISNKALEKARKGVYNQIEISRGLPTAYLLKYFRQDGAHWYINEKVKKLVRFEKINLLEAPKKIFQKFDVIFVDMY